MEYKVVLSPKKIVSKEFKVDFKGYNADEVHSWVIESGIPKNVDDYKFYDIIDNRIRGWL